MTASENFTVLKTAFNAVTDTELNRLDVQSDDRPDICCGTWAGYLRSTNARSIYLLVSSLESKRAKTRECVTFDFNKLAPALANIVKRMWRAVGNGDLKLGEQKLSYTLANVDSTYIWKAIKSVIVERGLKKAAVGVNNNKAQQVLILCL